MAEIKIRKYQNSDWVAVMQLLTETMDYHMSIQVPERFHSSSRKLLADYLRSLVAVQAHGRGLLLIAENKKGEPLGFIYGDVDKQDRELQKHAHKSGTIHELYINEHARGQGVGKKLMTKMEEWLKKKHCSLLRVAEVHYHNHQAQKFYQSQGYVVRLSEYAKAV